ncbi:MAG: histidine phosphatase family protein [Alphaproteobacteria bacterium]|nr:histidine phosphatase family protein [Alphaproteobacteria bacterium]MCB9931772.1 histidine phosphatase family protein [Alphaproteobacteria bacterium]
MPDRTARCTELLLIRHAPVDDGTRLHGRDDVAAALPGATAIAEVLRVIGPVDRVVSSPALRCRQTAEALFPDRPTTVDPRLWEQDFGAWEGMPLGDLPDIGPLNREDLARHVPPGGESFAALCARAAPALTELGGAGGRVAVIAHAGIIRAALALAIGSVAAGLAFEIAPLSLTEIRCFGGEHRAIRQVNRPTHS